MKKMILILLSLLLFCSCDLIDESNKTAISNTSEIIVVTKSSTQTPVPTETPIPAPSIDAFDLSYENIDLGISHLIVSGDRIYYTSAAILYCYDNETNSKAEIMDELSSEDIYLFDGYIYCLKHESLNRINVITNETEIVAYANDRENDVFKDYKIPGVDFSDYLLYGDTMMIQCSTLIEGWDDFAEFATVVEIGKWDFNHNFLSNMNMDYFDNEVEKVNDENGNELRIRYYYNSIMENPKKRVGVKITAESNSVSGNTFDGSAVFSNDKAYLTGWTRSCSYINGYNISTGEKIYSKDVGYAAAKPIAINQYILYYYFDRLNLEEYNTDQGVVLIDTKNDKVYENEEINNLLSGGFDYNVFYHSDYFLDGDTLYILQNELNEKEYSRNDEDMDGILVYDMKTYVKFPSKANIYKAEVINGKLDIVQIYKEFDFIEN